MHLVFKIIVRENINLDIPMNKTMEFPVHKHEIIEMSEKIIIYNFMPGSRCDIEKYTEYLKSYFKRKFQAYSVTVGELQKQLK